MGETARHIFFSGRVQGVGFRFTTQRIAERCGLAGFVRNCTDGRVETLVQGPADDVATFLEQLREAFAGYIRNTEIEDLPPEPRYQSFRITF